MPELATIYFAGLMVCLTLTLLFTFLRSRRQKSLRFRTLETNLQKAGFYWSENQDNIVAWEPGREEADAASLNRSMALAGAVLSLLSWAGAFFYLLIMVSYRFLARSRREQRIFTSRLAKDSQLTASEVRHLIDSLDLETVTRAPQTNHPLS